MKYANCPFCNGTSLFVEKVSTNQLIDIYQKYLSIDISHQFKDIKFIDFLKCEKCGLKFINPLITGDDYFYQKLESMESYYPQCNKTEFIFAKQLIKKQDKVLDIGAGRGVFGKYIDCKYYQGIDFSLKAIELAQSDGINVKAIPIQEHCIDKKEFYDVIVLFQIIEHIGSDINSFLSSSLKCLKQGGRLVVAVPNNDGYIQYVENFCLNLPPHHALFWNESSLRALATRYNLHIEKIYRAVMDIKQWYAVMINRCIHRLLGMKINKVNANFWNRKLFALLYKFARIVKYTYVHKNSSGHTIIIVYNKK
jgi:2-polyprenyl-3-methyl-5-hydroxy-6-metoxy-1,4-benzoquinol methylase